MRKITLGISACLLGNAVRYDGGHKLDPFLTDTLGVAVDWVPVCPETECGLPVPREAMHLVGDPDRPRLVTVKTGVDHTERMKLWARRRLAELADLGISGYVCKSRSPSSGLRGVKVHAAGGAVREGAGLFAAVLRERFPLLPMEDDERLHDPALRENFIERVFVHQRWQEFRDRDGTFGGLAAFHSDHKYLLMAHSRKHCRELDALVAAGKKLRRGDRLLETYPTLLMEGLRLLATPAKNAMVLQQLTGFLKERLAKDEDQELRELISRYREGLVPLLVPVTLINHYAREWREPSLLRQHYLQPHPLELLLRYHS